MTLADFKSRVNPPLDSHDFLDQLSSGIDTEQTKRITADMASLFATLLVVKSVKVAPSTVKTASLYEAIGYIRKFARKTGIHLDHEHTSGAGGGTRTHTTF